MRRIKLQVPAARLHDAYDILLAHLPAGVHATVSDDDVELVALGEQGELPPIGEVRAWIAHLASGPVVEEDAGPDLAHALAAAMPRHEIAGRIAVRNPLQPAPPAGWIDVVLERGAGFGTGSHPTTRHCLELLLSIEPRGAFADLGCGAGALTIAAAKLGFAPVVGVDLLADATATAARNAVANDAAIDFVTADLQTLTQLEVRTAVVNVSETNVHEHLAGVPAPDLRNLVVSGLEDPNQLATALIGYARAGLHEETRIDALRWPAVLLRR